MELWLIYLGLIFPLCSAVTRSDQRASVPCPLQCRCRVVQTTSVKVDCVGKSIEKVEGLNFPPNTVVLDLSGNVIKKITAADFLNLDQLDKLNLSGNLIDTVENYAFRTLTNLTKLDLSMNKLVMVSEDMLEGLGKLKRLDISHNEVVIVQSRAFAGLSVLQRLSLSGNQFTTLPHQVFTPMQELNKIDFSTDQLFCNCSLKWLVGWIRRSQVNTQDTKCAFPVSLRNKPVKELRESELVCGVPVKLKKFVIEPGVSPHRFVGDPLLLTCQASKDIPFMSMHWMRAGKTVVTNETLGIRVTEPVTVNNRILQSAISVDSLALEDSGAWTCFVQTPQGNDSKSASIFVLPGYKCQELTMDTAKGRYTWPPTIPGARSYLPCAVGDKTARAKYECSGKGKWVSLDLKQCKYKNEITQVLETFAQGDLNMTTSYMAHMNQLSGMLMKPMVLTDKMDVIFIARGLHRISNQLKLYTKYKIPQMVFNITNLLMNVNSTLLLEAQREERSCTSLVETLKRVVNNEFKFGSRTEMNVYTDTIAVEARRVRSDVFQGITCTAYQTLKSRKTYLVNNFYCDYSPSSTDKVKKIQQGIDAHIHIPANALPTHHSDDYYNVMVIVYRGDQMFPRVVQDRKYYIPSSVITASVGDVKVENLDDPVVIGLPSKQPEGRLALKAVYWDPQASDWREDGCSVEDTIIKSGTNVSILHCNHLTSFALLQERTYGPKPLLLDQVFIVMEPQFYIGSSILCICMLITICTYVSAYRSISLSKKLKHALINTCQSILLLKIVFIFGVKIKQDDACKVMGVAIHYFSICTIFWITVASWSIYKKLSRSDRPKIRNEDVTAPLPPSPMLKFYLFAWGIPVIICGITGAVNINFYKNSEYCFVAWKPGLLAFYGVIGLFILINLILFVFICCVRETPEKAYLEEMISLNPVDQCNPDTGSNTQSVRSSLADQEYKPRVQMAGIVLFLILYILMWASAAFSIYEPLHKSMPSMDTILSFLYMMLCIVLGVFVVVFYCFARNDTRSLWRNCHQGPAVETMVSTSQRSHTNINVITHTNASHTSAYPSESGIESELAMKTSSANQLKPLMQIMQYHKQASVMSHSDVDRSVQGGPDDMPIFYNRKQNGVAKRYWEKKRSSSNRDMASSVMSGNESMHSQAIHNQSPTNTDPGNTHLSIEIQIQSHNPKQARRQRIGSASSEPADYRNHIHHSMPKSPMSDNKGIFIHGQMGPGGSYFKTDKSENEYTQYPAEMWQNSAPRNSNHNIQTAHVPPSVRAKSLQLIQPGYIRERDKPYQRSDSHQKQAYVQKYIRSMTPSSRQSDEESRHSHHSRRSSHRSRNRHPHRRQQDSDNESARFTHQSHDMSQSQASLQSRSTARSHKSSRSSRSHRHRHRIEEPLPARVPVPGAAEENLPLVEEDERLNIHHSSSDNNSSHYACVGLLPENKLINNQQHEAERSATPSSCHSLPLKKRAEPTELNTSLLQEETIYENVHKHELPVYENLEKLRQVTAAKQASSPPAADYELPVYENLFSLNEYNTLTRRKLQVADKEKSAHQSVEVTNNYANVNVENGNEFAHSQTST